MVLAEICEQLQVINKSEERAAGFRMEVQRALLDTVIVVSIVAIASVGFVAGMKELIMDVRKLRRAKV